MTSRIDRNQQIINGRVRIIVYLFRGWILRSNLVILSSTGIIWYELLFISFAPRVSVRECMHGVAITLTTCANLLTTFQNLLNCRIQEWFDAKVLNDALHKSIIVFMELILLLERWSGSNAVVYIVHYWYVLLGMRSTQIA